MLEGIENAINNLSMEVIEVDIAYYHPDDENGVVDETIKVYDDEGMREEFEYKLKQVIKNN
jgi:N-dimethylarginine dimethylaminohydrolase